MLVYLFNVRCFQALAMMANFSLEYLAIHALGNQLKVSDVASIMETLRVLEKRLPVRIVMDNGSE